VCLSIKICTEITQITSNFIRPQLSDQMSFYIALTCQTLQGSQKFLTIFIMHTLYNSADPIFKYKHQTNIPQSTITGLISSYITEYLAPQAKGIGWSPSRWQNCLIQVISDLTSLPTQKAYDIVPVVDKTAPLTCGFLFQLWHLLYADTAPMQHWYCPGELSQYVPLRKYLDLAAIQRKWPNTNQQYHALQTT